MKTIVQQLVQNNLDDYKIVLVPHEDLLHKIIELRQQFATEQQLEQPMQGIPELVLARFKQLPFAEQRIKNRLKVVAMGRPAIKVELKDFGSFPSHTIFINVTSKVPLTELIKMIRQETQRLMKPDAENKPHFLTDFYIPLAVKLKPWQYEQGWQQYSHKHFTGKFIASKMLLLKKKHGEFKFKPVEAFDFQNLPVETKQGLLF